VNQFTPVRAALWLYCVSLAVVIALSHGGKTETVAAGGGKSRPALPSPEKVEARPADREVGSAGLRGLGRSVRAHGLELLGVLPARDERLCGETLTTPARSASPPEVFSSGRRVGTPVEKTAVRSWNLQLLGVRNLVLSLQFLGARTAVTRG
jgi:hypothetical protein